MHKWISEIPLGSTQLGFCFCIYILCNILSFLQLLLFTSFHLVDTCWTLGEETTKKWFLLS